MSRLRVIASLVLFGFAAWILVPSFIASTRSSAAHAANPAGTEVAIFAGGCFWCVESDFDKVPGVISTTSGYIGGQKANPTYREVSGGSTGHAEAVKIVYDPKVVSFDRLLFVFWRTVDPVTRDAQFCDYGTQYRTAIFFMNDVQRQKALASKAELEKSGKLKRPIVTEIVQAGPFFAAEDYHQDYYQKNPFQYNLYRFNCGRDARLDELWGKEAGGGTH
jgi:peptide-methionine (S)-S-oxide reductase